MAGKLQRMAWNGGTMNKRDRDTRGGDQSSTGVGNDDRDRQGQRVQDPDSPHARGEERSTSGKPSSRMESRNAGSGPRPNKAGRGSTVDTGNRSSRGEDGEGRPTRSGSKSNAS
jgi:hypothetical protein